DEIHRCELDVSGYAFDRMREIEGINIIGSDKAEEHNGIITFTVDDVHPHDISEILASDGVAVRAGHHCAQPLLKHLGYRATVRASFAFYNTKEDADKFLESISTVRERMGYGKQKLL
ncbi:MAG: aminotransferase class V-fold PLP-dependent enzyme, partial [Clostridiales bacterium]|nr:aminotransferase class V-fold PLP-dependent enzyme [Clostridiales bacterium]